MTMRIGERLRKQRLRKGITQEQLAEALGVTPQAVSRWENDTSYPDITLLPGLAYYYATTVDELIGMDELRRQEAVNAVHTRILNLVAVGRAEEAAACARDGLRLYPGDSGLMMALAETLAHLKGDAALREAIALEERVLRQNSVSMKARSTASVNLMFLYLRAGEREKARALVKSLPHIWESREILLPEVAGETDYAEELRKCVRHALVFLCRKIDGRFAHAAAETPDYVQLGVNFQSDQSTDELLDKIRAFLAGR